MYSVLDMIFSPILWLSPIYAEAVLAIMLTFLITLFYRVLTDPVKLKELRERAKELNEKIKEVQKKDPEEAKRLTGEMLKITNQQFRANLKPMFLTMILILAFFPWLASTFSGLSVKLPFTLPFFGSDFGWLMWYILISIPASQIFRKLLGVDL